MTSDGHKRIQAAMQKEFVGASWQMCNVHFMRAVLKNIPMKDKKEVAYMLKDSLEDECKMQELAVILDDRGAKKSRLIASDLTFGTANRFPDSTGAGLEQPTA